MTIPSSFRTAGIGLLAFLAVACSDDDSPAGTDTGEQLVLPLRVHVLESSTVPALDADLSDPELSQLMTHVNDAWAQANIRWEVVATFHETAVPSEEFQRAIRGEIPLTRDAILSVLPLENRQPGGWDIFVIHDTGVVGIAGAYLGDGLAVSKLTNGGPVDLADFASRVFAHELGHSLSLAHVPCPPEGNLMAPGCPAPDRTRLEEFQIERARVQAATGEPF